MVLAAVAAAWGVGGCTTTKPADRGAALAGGRGAALAGGRGAALAGDAANAATNGTPRVHVVFANPQEFTDARSSLGGGADARNLDPLGEFLVRETSKQLRPGERMGIVFHDVDLAGDFEPGGLSSTGDVRIVREIYPPRLKFEYTIVDQTDTVVAQGTVTLSNHDFLRELLSPVEQQEPLAHEKKMLREWVMKTLAPRRQAPVAPLPSLNDEKAP